jgi:hypothetical protein
LTSELLSRLDTFSGNRLKRKEDLAVLLELGSSPPRDSTLEELSFHAKFLQRAHLIMQRIGTQGEGYDRLSREFGSSLDKAFSLLRNLLGGATADTRNRFDSLYLAMTQEGLSNFLALCGDLAWYKNLCIDEQRTKGKRP